MLAFPDTYEIGISNQAIQILYGLARSCSDVGVERTYLPWVDAITEMRENDIPLLTLETWASVASADLLGVTLQHESNLTNLLELLDLSGLPVRSADRVETHPLVIVGGPACANFAPFSPFVDAVVSGDGEEVFAEILELLRGTKHAEASRAEKKSRLAGIEGVFVPGLSESVTRRCVSRLEDAPYPSSCLVPLTEGVHDRAWVEVMRGCTRGCRFCQAGMWYRPVRERHVEQILKMAEEQLRVTGYQEVSLASLSTTDHTCIERLLTDAARVLPEVRISLPSLRVDSAGVRLAGLTSPTGGSLTLAPEAGSQRMRDVINKNVTEADVLGAVEEAIRAGKNTLKLYFMIGLPWEEDEDASAIADLCIKIRDHARSAMGSRANRLQLNISVNNFIPKPFTPFQWAGMADRETLTRRYRLVREKLRKPGVRVSFSRLETSYLEAALARGGEELADVIEGAWQRGARMDSWTEEFVQEAWDEAFAEAGLSAESLATATIGRDAALPWDVVGGVADREFLVREWDKAAREETTPDCRWDECAECGVCGGSLAIDLAGPVKSERGGARAEAVLRQPDSEGDTAGVVRDRPAIAQRWRYVANFSVTGRGRFLGHLDRAEIFRRAVRRAGGRLALSAGMRPKALLSLALPLAVGVEGLNELAEFELAEPVGEEFSSRLDEALPDHMRLVDLQSYDERRSLAARVVGASYEVTVTIVGDGAETIAKLEETGRRFEEAEAAKVEVDRGGRTRQVDAREYVDEVQFESRGSDVFALAFRAKISPTGTVRPELVVRAVEMLSGLDLTIQQVKRTQIYLDGGEV